jgi:hypothetical protein
MSLEHNPSRQRREASEASAALLDSIAEAIARRPNPVDDPTYTVKTFCTAEHMSRSMLYRAWSEGWGPEFYWVGNTRRITQRARLDWQKQREAAAREVA